MKKKIDRRHHVPERVVPEKAYKNGHFLSSVSARPLRILAEYFEPLQRFQKYRVRNTIVFFGSARLMSSVDATQMLKEREQSKASKAQVLEAKKMVKMAKYYDDAVELSRLLTVWSKQTFGNSKKRYLICTGGGPGIMEAGNRGAYIAEGESVGLSISLPFEANANPFITPELNFEFHYFFTRKYWFSYLAKALVIFPGGFGTLDELAEVLTLLQTKKIKKNIPIVMYGSSFWNKVINMQALVDHGTISQKDLDLMTFCDTPKQAFDFIKKQVRKYHD
ncbi:MAG: LOG family protein [Deltaproteobacteria bacterium]|nr:LOG family protein [Deltaproteobacteria bacterium]